ncbi:MAG: hypothetical protein UU47_C0028G0006 [candidate division TM6 bacterium GW2011_GWE2_41_16]|nr:MAG: hypothetical protein UU47_C0028G0006 [candidate division TM6 bacterium GW2011_GWE2_41_16]
MKRLFFVAITPLLIVTSHIHCTKSSSTHTMLIEVLDMRMYPNKLLSLRPLLTNPNEAFVHAAKHNNFAIWIQCLLPKKRNLKAHDIEQLMDPAACYEKSMWNPAIDVNFFGQDDQTALMWAAKNHNAVMITILLHHPDINPNLINAHGQTARDIAQEQLDDTPLTNPEKRIAYKSIIEILSSTAPNTPTTTTQPSPNGFQPSLPK